MPTGEQLNREWEVNASHALYREDGKLYHLLDRFPGALFDAHGYILFKTREEYVHCTYLSIGDEINIRDGISAIPGYVRVI
jgi:5-methylcytosine-specific restriction protein A